MTMDKQQVGDPKAFTAIVLEHQEKLKDYIAFVVSDRNVLEDVLQEVNLTLLDKEKEYNREKDFFPWACGVAKLKILSHFRDKKRERVSFDSDLIETLAGKAVAIIESKYDVRREKMEQCLTKLPPEQNRLMWMHYGENYSVEEIADIQRRKYDTIRKILYRIRAVLVRCVEQM